MFRILKGISKFIVRQYSDIENGTAFQTLVCHQNTPRSDTAIIWSDSRPRVSQKLIFQAKTKGEHMKNNYYWPAQLAL